ncbi:MAG: response regulator, partial [Acidobacteria bacterium]|nr:response regulator [Acidobacteriota bacterium]
MSATEARVLIIEDNDALRAMLFTILRHQPLGVDTSAGAEDALEKTRQCDYALILIDMSLAGDEALAFLTRFHEERPEATTFVLAVRDPNSEMPLDASLVSAMVNKPLEIDTLADVVRECALVVPPPEDPLPCPPAES